MSYKVSKRTNALSYFSDLLRKRKPPLFLKKLKASNWNMFENDNNHLVVVLLQGSDNTEDHCVTICGKWIFDSNLKNAIPLSKESLDLCCSSDGDPVSFVKVVKALLCTNYLQQVESKRKQMDKQKKGSMGNA